MVKGRKTPFGRCVLLAAVWLTCPSPVSAHKLTVLAETEGSLIRGRAYYYGGTSAQGAPVVLLDDGGEKVGQTTTDQEGKFRLVAPYRCDYRVVVDPGDGHRAQYDLPASALPASLPLPPRGAEPDRGPRPAPPAAQKVSDPGSGDAGLAAQVERLVEQVVQLRMQLAEYGQRVRVQDIVAGTGYILGISGVAFFFRGARRKRPGQ
jgi:nickel transport protein